jgi:hypothetical protein
MNNYIIRELDNNDFNNGYFELMYEFTNSKCNITFDDFNKYLDIMKNLNKIVVVY